MRIEQWHDAIRDHPITKYLERQEARHMGIWDGKVVEFTYTNYRGVTEVRRVVPIRIWFGTTEWHPVKQWFLHAWDLERQAARDFTWSEIQGWAEAEDQSLPWRL